MTYRHNAYERYLHNRTGKRLIVPTGDVSYVYQSQRKRRLKVEISGPTKYPVGIVELPFYLFQMAEAAIQNTVLMLVSRKRTGNEKSISEGRG
jgi:hypothetical protein